MSSTPYYLKDVSTCAAACDNGFYGNDTTNLCVACPAACLTCTSSTSCQSCQSVHGVGYYLSGVTCTISCPITQYGRVSDYTCQNCATGCLACFGGSITQCYNCTNSTSNFYLDYGTTTCTQSCPDGEYSTTDNLCLLCSSTCITCINTAAEC